MKTFTVYRRGDLSETHNSDQVNPPDEPQFEGVVFGDGTCVIRWMTAGRSTSVWSSFEEMWKIHGHDDPNSKHGTEIVWADDHDRQIGAQIRLDLRSWYDSFRKEEQAK